MTKSDTSLHKRSGTGLRLAVVVALGFVPVLVFFIYWIETQRRDAHNDAEAWTRNAAQEIAAQHEHFLHQVKQTLEMVAVSRAATSASPAECERLLVNVRERRDWMKDAWIVGASGDVLCSTNPSQPAPDLDADHRRSLEQSGFAITGVRADRDGAAHHIVAAMTFGTNADSHRVLIETRIDVLSLAGLAVTTDRRDDTVVIALDHKGLVMSHSSGGEHLIGQSMRAHPVIGHLLEFVGMTHVGVLHDDVERVLGSARVPGWGSTIVVGIGRESVLATSRGDLYAGLAVFLLVMMTTGGTAWLSATQLILQPVRAVRDTALSMAGGNFGRRVAPHRGPREVQEMARAFNSMADRLEGLALNDALTGLPNRRALDAYLARLLEASRPFAVLTIDLDEFKPVNDRLGHAAGDETLRTISNRLVDCVKDIGLCARVGGDEFVAVLPGSDGVTLGLRAIALGERIRAAISAPITVNGTKVGVASSVGIAVRQPGAGLAKELLHNADRALYAAKAAGRNQVVVFDGSQPDVYLRDESGRLRVTPTAA